METVATMLAQPSEHQKQTWWDYVAIQDEPVLHGTALVWCGWCPLCDEVKSDENLTARFDFRRGLMYCENGKDGKSCHGKRSISLNNVLVRMGQKSG